MIGRNLGGLTGDATALRTVYHAADASYPRPAGAAPILWVGTVSPTGMVAGDIWANSSPTPVVPAWTPASIGTLQGWYDPSVLGLANGASLTGLNDRSTNARNLSLNSEAPTFSAAGLGGHAAVNFGTSTVGTLDSATISVAGAVTYFMNFQVADLTAIRSLVGSATSTDLSIQTRTSGAGFVLRRTATDITVSYTLTTGVPHTAVAVMNGISSAFYIDGTLITSGTLGTGDITKVRLGRRGDGQQRHSGLIGDVFWMTGVPDTPTLASAHAWLAARRGA